jgi:hypothetical protein
MMLICLSGWLASGTVFPYFYITKKKDEIHQVFISVLIHIHVIVFMSEKDI